MPPPASAPHEKILERVLLVSAVDGWSVVAIAGPGTLLALVMGDFAVGAAGLLIAGAGLAELRGRRRLQQRDPGGMKLLVRAQLLLLGALWAYAWYRWRFFDATELWPRLPGPAQNEITRQLALAGLDPVADRPLLLEMMNTLVCATLAFFTFLFQGGLIFYYASRAARVREALAAPPQSPLA